MAKRPPQEKAPGSLGAECRVGLLHGKEALLRQLHTETLKSALIKAHGGVDVFVFDGTTARAADVLDECRSFGLIAGYKLVILDNAEAMIKDAARPLFERYCESVAGDEEVGATLLLRAPTWRPGNLDKLIAGVGAIVKCDEPGFDEAVRWVEKRAAKEHKASITPDAAQMLVERVGTSLTRLDNELGKLAAAAGAGEIAAPLVGYFVGASREEQAWGIQSSLLGAGPGEALAHLRYILDVSRQPTQVVSWAMIDLARKLHAASRALRQGAQPGEITGPLKIWGPAGNALLAAARKIDPDAALALFRAAVRADQRQKSGLGDPERGLEMLVLEFARAQGRGAASLAVG